MFFVKLAGSCALPITLQAVDIPVITDAECTAQWGNNYNGDVHVCVWDSVNQDRGACNVRLHFGFKIIMTIIVSIFR